MDSRRKSSVLSMASSGISKDDYSTTAKFSEFQELVFRARALILEVFNYLFDVRLDNRVIAWLYIFQGIGSY